MEASISKEENINSIDKEKKKEIPLVHEDIYPTGAAKWILIITAISCAVLELIDTTVVNVSLREISGNIGATTTEIAWVITAYSIANVIVIPLSSMLSNLFAILH